MAVTKKSELNQNGFESELHRQTSPNNSDYLEPVAEILYDKICLTGEEAYAQHESVEINYLSSTIFNNLPTGKKSWWNIKRQALERNSVITSINTQ